MDSAAVLNRISKLIQIDATTPDRQDFMLTHVPFENLYIDNRKSITEKDLLNKYLLDDRGQHKFILIQGDNGSGKSHLVRWLKEKYIGSIDRNIEAPLFISRVHNTLQDALEQLLDSPVFPEEVKENELRNIKNARSNVTGEELKKTINFNFTLEIDADDKNAEAQLDLRTRKMLGSYLKTDYIINEFLMGKSGPLERVRSKIENCDGEKVNYNEGEMFVEQDFAISHAQITQYLKARDERAADVTIRLAEKFADPRYGEILRKSVAKYLNDKVGNVIQKSMKLQTSDFKKLFMALRKSLKDKGMSLTLFIEDINAFTGIDNALMEVLIANHEAEGNEDYCRIISVVGSTTDFYNNRINDSIKDRITTNIYIREESVLGTEKKLVNFAAKYINAVSIDEKDVANWVNEGMSEEDIPIVLSPYKFSEVRCYGKKMSIFPFNSTALKNLYDSMPLNIRSPRMFLRDVIKSILKLWYSDKENFLSSEDNFTNTSIHVRSWVQATYENANERIDKKSAVARSILLRVWGNATPENQNGILGGLTQEVFDAFDVFANISGKPVANSTETTTPIPAPSVEKTDKTIDIIQKPRKLSDLESDVNDWMNNNSRLINHAEFRKYILQFITTAINWNLEEVPLILVEKCVKSLNYIYIEGDGLDIKHSGLVLPRNSNTALLLNALANWYYMGAQSWDFNGGEDYYVFAMAWLEKNTKSIVNMVETDHIRTDNLYLWNIASVYGIKSLFGGVDLGKNQLEICIEILGKSPKYEKSGRHGEAWDALQNGVIRNAKSEKSTYTNALALFSKSVGYGYKPTEYIFVDIIKIEEQVKKLKLISWNLTEIEMPDVGKINPDAIWYNALELLKTFTKSINIAMEQEQVKANIYTLYFTELLGDQITIEVAEETLTKVKQFLKYLLEEMNLSYESNHIEILENGTPNKLVSAFSKIEKVIGDTGSDVLTKISKNAFDEIDGYYLAFNSFCDILDSKKQIFDTSYDSKIQMEIDTNKEILLKESVDMLLMLEKIGGGINE